MIEKLTNLIAVNTHTAQGSSSVVMQYHYLRGSYYFSQGEFMLAFADFDVILKQDASQFPHSMILRMMYDMTEAEFASLQDAFFKHNDVWRSLKEQAGTHSLIAFGRR